ncbi:hypothetical protein ACFYQA_00235 [Streptomyces sp. NPDC005774]|uniref:hypothetical protein n=1 Tax=Streptomyces sp. NPDC005774 TaxID=3364728 RepID=UPI0036C50EAF
MQQLVEEFGIVTATAGKVNVGLKKEGLVHAEVGTGSFVTADAPAILGDARAKEKEEAT